MSLNANTLPSGSTLFATPSPLKSNASATSNFFRSFPPYGSKLAHGVLGSEQMFSENEVITKTEDDQSICTVLSYVGQGELGQYYRVRMSVDIGTEWAMRATPLPSQLSKQERDCLLLSLLREFRAMLRVGRHGNVVAGYFVYLLKVSESDFIFLLFTDFSDQGTLASWFASSRLTSFSFPDLPPPITTLQSLPVFSPPPSSLPAAELAFRRRKFVYSLMLDTAYALNHIHAAGLVHHNVQPQNVLLIRADPHSNDVRGLITDYGTSTAQVKRKNATPAPSNSSSPVKLPPKPSSPLMSTDQLLRVPSSSSGWYAGGSPVYWSKEQSDSYQYDDAVPSVTQRSDIYSWALLVLQLFAGNCFWEGRFTGDKGRRISDLFLSTFMVSREEDHDPRTARDLDLGSHPAPFHSAGDITSRITATSSQPFKHLPATEPLVRMPYDLFDVLESCLVEDQTRRVQSFDEILYVLYHVYEREVGSPYIHRQLPALSPQLRQCLWSSHNYLGTAFRRMRLYDDAIAEFEAAENLMEHSDSRLNLISAWLSMGKVDLARTRVHEWAPLYPGSALWKYNLGLVSSRLGDHDNAEVELRQAIMLDSNLAEAYATLGAVLMKKGQLLEAKEMITKAIELKPTEPEPFFNLGMIHLNLKDAASGVESFATALKLEREAVGRIEVHMAVAEIMGQLGKLDKGIEILQDVLRIRPYEKEAYLKMIRFFSAKKQHAEALQVYSELLRLYPVDLDILRQYGMFLMDCDKLTESQQIFERLLRMDPSDVTSHYELGMVFLRKNRTQQAIDHFREVTRLAPDEFDGHNTLGRVLISTNELDEAICELRRAVELAPGDHRGHFHLGQALSKKGQLNEAYACYERVLVLAPNDIETRVRMNEIILLLQGADHPLN